MRKKVIIDCDPGIDDSLAIMLALSCDQIEVLGITIVCGNSPTEMGAGNAAKVLRQMNRLDIPIFTGERTPLKRDYVNALDTHGADGLGESFLEPVENLRSHLDGFAHGARAFWDYHKFLNVDWCVRMRTPVYDIHHRQR